MCRIVWSFLACAMLPGIAEAETLPWLNMPAAKPPVSAGQGAAQLPWANTPSAVKHNAMPVPMTQPPIASEVEGPQTREQDDRKLNAIAQDFYEVSPTKQGAVSKYAALQKQAADFRKVLERRSYGAHDILSDLKKMQGRIDAAKKKAQAAAKTEKVSPAKTASSKSVDQTAQEALDALKKAK